MAGYIFCVFDWKHPLWANLVQKIKIFCLSWNLVRGLFRYAEFISDVHFLSFWLEILSWANLFKNIKIVTLDWRLIWICGIQWWRSFLLFLTGNTLLGKFYPQSWSFVCRNFKYAEFIRCSLFFNFDQIFPFWR